MNLTCLVRDSPEPPQYIFWWVTSESLMFEAAIKINCQVPRRGAHLLLLAAGRHQPDHREGGRHRLLPPHTGDGHDDGHDGDGSGDDGSGDDDDDILLDSGGEDPRLRHLRLPRQRRQHQLSHGPRVQK